MIYEVTKKNQSLLYLMNWIVVKAKRFKMLWKPVGIRENLLIKRDLLSDKIYDYQWWY